MTDLVLSPIPQNLDPMARVEGLEEIQLIMRSL